MPNIKIYTNVKSSSVEKQELLKSLSTSLAAALGFPATNVMLHLKMDQDLVFRDASHEPCAFVQVRSTKQFGPEVNGKIHAELTDAVVTSLNIPADRIIVLLDQLQPHNLSIGGRSLHLQ